MSILASSAISALTAATLIPSGTWLAAAQSPIYTTAADRSAAVTSAPSSIEVIPRGKDVSNASVPFRRNLPPRNNSTASMRTGRTNQDDSSGQRGRLQTPVFMSSHQTDGRVTENSPANGAREITKSTAPSAATTSYNYVRASGVASLPHAGYSQSGLQAPWPATSQVSHPTRPAGFQESAEPDQPLGAPDLRIPQQQEVHQPGTPVPAVPFVFEQNVDGLSTDSSDPQVPFPSSIPSHDTSGGVKDGSPPFGSEEPQIGADTLRSNAHSASGVTRQSPAQRSTPRRIKPGPAPGTSGFRATVEADAPQWIGPYMGRTDMAPQGAEYSPTPAPSIMMPLDFTAWWDGPVQQGTGIAPRTMAVDVTSLVQQALVYSPQVQVLQADPEIQQRVVKQEEAAFDWRAFLDAKYDDLNDPIGNTLTTGNNDNRFTDHHTTSSSGVKRRTSTGGEVKLAQQFGYQDNNSRFLLPNPQSTSRLELSFRQPLMSRSGTVYNQNQIILARIGANSSGDETIEELQKHLFSVAEAYWKLYRARAEFLQRKKLLASAQRVLETLEGRNQVDTIPRQILRARASVARAESRMQRAVTDIRNSESQLRLLVNDPEMLNGGPVEFTPTETPSMLQSPTSLRDSLQDALVNRPDISFAIRQMRASGVRMGVSKSEMLPKLDFIVSSYVAGLQNQAQLADSFNNQFTQGRPGYTVGMEFEVALGSRAAKARVEQRQWELKRAINSFRATVETSLTEVEISNREVETAWRELLGKFQAMSAAQNEVSYLQDRFDVLPMVEESSILLLEDLLDGYERLADEEAAFAQAQTNYALSIIQLRRTTGTMLRSRHDAPELENEESSWMATRADQAAIDAEEKTTQTAGRAARSSSVSDSASVSASVPALRQPLQGRSRTAVSAPVRPKGKIGGHSFGNESE